MMCDEEKTPMHLSICFPNNLTLFAFIAKMTSLIINNKFVGKTRIQLTNIQIESTHHFNI